MDDFDSKCKQKMKKVVKLGVRIAWLTVDWLV